MQLRVSTDICWFVVVMVNLVFFYFHRCVFLTAIMCVFVLSDISVKYNFLCVFYFDRCVFLAAICWYVFVLSDIFVKYYLECFFTSSDACFLQLNVGSWL